MIRILALCLALGACAVTSSLAETEIALTTAERAALAYATLPRCPAVTMCHTPEAVARIKVADDIAYAAVKAARTRHGDANSGAAISSRSHEDYEGHEGLHAQELRVLRVSPSLREETAGE